MAALIPGRGTLVVAAEFVVMPELGQNNSEGFRRAESEGRLQGLERLVVAGRLGQGDAQVDPGRAVLGEVGQKRAAQAMVSAGRSAFDAAWRRR